MAYDDRSFIFGVIDAAKKRQDANNALKAEVAKVQLQSKIRQQEQLALSRQKMVDSMIQQNQKDRFMNPQKYTPEQEYLRRRAMEQNPLMSMNVPEEGQDMSQGITFPSQEVGNPNKQGIYQPPQELSPERKTQLLRYKVDQMIAQGRKPHPAVLSLLQKQEDYLKQQKEHSMSKEDRLLRGQDLQTLRTYGGSLDDEKLKSYGIDVESYAKAGGATPIIGPDGKRKWQIMPYEQFKAKVSEGKWGKAEIDNFQDRVTENTRWKQVLENASRVGIDESNIEDLGKIEFDVVNTPMGPFSIPAKFNLAGQYLKDPAYTSLKRSIELAFSAFRKRVTGAQAGEKELQLLREIVPSLQDRPGVFFDTIRTLIDGSTNEMKSSLELYKAFGRDTTQLEKYLSNNSIDLGSTDSQEEDYKEGDVLENDKGERVQLKNGQWVKV